MSETVVPPLNAAQSRVLRIVSEGGKMESRRVYPYPRKYLLFSKTGKEYASKVPEGTVSALIEMRLVRAVQLDTTGDRIIYHTTTLGVRAVQRRSALPPEDHSQLELIDEPGHERQSA